MVKVSNETCMAPDWNSNPKATMASIVKIGISRNMKRVIWNSLPKL